VHFSSLFGTYQTECIKFNEKQMLTRFSGEIFEGYQSWRVKVSMCAVLFASATHRHTAAV
jgi:hypothetical protein